MAANDKTVDERLDALEDQVLPREPTKQELDEAQQAADALAAEAKQRNDEAEKERKKALEDQQAKDDEERERLEQQISQEVDQRNIDNGAHIDVVDPVIDEPDPIPEPPPLDNDHGNVHNDGELDGSIAPVQEGHAEPEPLEQVIARNQWLEDRGMTTVVPEVQPVVTVE
jgi:hypothetical protein